MNSFDNISHEDYAANFSPSEVEQFDPNLFPASQYDETNSPQSGNTMDPPFDPDPRDAEPPENNVPQGKIERESREIAEEISPEKSRLLDELSSESTGRWNRLVSRTNWEKGEVILRWRTALIEAGLPNTLYSDDAWAKRVGNVSPQHIGRLRRVFERFGTSFEHYASLYWSHFQAALDWEDAEMWLEGANLNQWSVATMRIQRWETLGAPEDMKPREQDVVLAELDEDVNPYNDSRSALEGTVGRIGPSDQTAGKNDDFEDESSETGKKRKKNDREEHRNPAGEDCPSTGEALARLAGIPNLPEDVAEPLDQLKIAILNHKLSGWTAVRPEELLGVLAALRVVILSKDVDG